METRWFNAYFETYLQKSTRSPSRYSPYVCQKKSPC